MYCTTHALYSRGQYAPLKNVGESWSNRQSISGEEAQGSLVRNIQSQSDGGTPSTVRKARPGEDEVGRAEKDLTHHAPIRHPN